MHGRVAKQGRYTGGGREPVYQCISIRRVMGVLLWFRRVFRFSCEMMVVRIGENLPFEVPTFGACGTRAATLPSPLNPSNYLGRREEEQQHQ